MDRVQFSHCNDFIVKNACITGTQYEWNSVHSQINNNNNNNVSGFGAIEFPYHGAINFKRRFTMSVWATFLWLAPSLSLFRNTDLISKEQKKHLQTLILSCCCCFCFLSLCEILKLEMIFVWKHCETNAFKCAQNQFASFQLKWLPRTQAWQNSFKNFKFCWYSAAFFGRRNRRMSSSLSKYPIANY